MKATRSGRILDNKDAALVKGMIDRGDRQHDIASYFGVNGGRIGETSTGEQFASVVAATTNLPPSSPYLVVEASLRARARKISVALKAMKAPQDLIDDADIIVAAFDASHQARRGV